MTASGDSPSRNKASSSSRKPKASSRSSKSVKAKPPPEPHWTENVAQFFRSVCQRALAVGEKTKQLAARFPELKAKFREAKAKALATQKESPPEPHPEPPAATPAPPPVPAIAATPLPPLVKPVRRRDWSSAVRMATDAVYLAPPALFVGFLIWLFVWERHPLGILGEWVWNRGFHPPVWGWIGPAFGFLFYLAVVIVGRRVVDQREWTAAIFLPLLFIVAGWQHSSWFAAQPGGFGPERWPYSIHQTATSGYLTQAREIDDLDVFLTGYHDWISDQDSFHIGTHPPGLFVGYRLLLDGFARYPKIGGLIYRSMPPRFRDSVSYIAATHGLQQNEIAAICGAAWLAWFAILATIFPIYGMTRFGGSPASAWLAASFWPLVPAGTVFLPLADCIYPLLSASLVFLLVASLQVRAAIPAVIAGALLGIGMFTTVAFLAMASIVAGVLVLWFLRAEESSIIRWIFTIIGFSAGFGLIVEVMWYEYSLNLFQVWKLNLEKHTGFYASMPRSYWPWVKTNALELAVSLGPTVAWLALLPIFSLTFWRSRDVRSAIVFSWLVTLLALNFSGRNLSEVARLWIFLMPFACVSASHVLSRHPLTFSRLVLWFTLQQAGCWLVLGGVEPLLPVPLR